MDILGGLIAGGMASFLIIWLSKPSEKAKNSQSQSADRPVDSGAMNVVSILKKMFFGFFWYLVFVNVLAFLICFFISASLSASGAVDPAHETMLIYRHIQLVVMTAALAFTIVLAAKGKLPGTRNKTVPPQNNDNFISGSGI